MMGTPILEDENMMQIGIMSKNLENVLRERSKTIKASWNSANMVSKNLLSEINTDFFTIKYHRQIMLQRMIMKTLAICSFTARLRLLFGTCFSRNWE